MSYKEKAIKQLRKGYSPIPAGPNEELNSIFKNFFKKFIDRNDLDFFMDIFDTNETILRAWSFLGLYYILKDKPIEDNEKIVRLRKIILDLLNDERKINYFSSSIETQSSLREHHITRICELDRTIVFEPILGYIQSSEKKADEIVGELLESVLSQGQDSRIEPLILQYGLNVNQKDFSVQLRIIKAFRNLGQNSPLKEKESITKIFKLYLNYIEDDKSESREINERIKLNIINKKRKLKNNIFKIAAELEIDLQKETFAFINALKTPYNGLKQIAKRFKDNERFKLILLKKLEEIDNPTLIKDILISIIGIRENIPNWKELIIENLNKFQIRDGDLITELEKINYLSEDILINFLIEAEKWQLEFIREILLNKPEKLDNLKEFRNEFINILNSFKQADESWDKFPNLKEKKELTLKIIIDLERKDMIEYCLENFINLEDEELKKIALFAIINFGTDALWLKLKSILKDNKEAAEFFKKFMRSMERKEWKLYY